MNRIVLAFAAAFPLVAHAAPMGLEMWEKNHPEASRELGEWVRNHPTAAARFFEWDGHHPLKSQEFVTWAIRRPRQSVSVFLASHPRWPVLDTIIERHRPAADAFVAWCRRHPRAAESLMSHPRALEWAGHHLYRSYWSLETPQAR